MRVSAKIDYAIRALVELAARRDEPVSGKQIADAQAIPDKFLTNIMTELAGHGLVRTQRGTLGGYWLGRPSEAISLADIIYAIDGSLTDVRGSQPEDLRYENAPSHSARSGSPSRKGSSGCSRRSHWLTS